MMTEDIDRRTLLRTGLSLAAVGSFGSAASAAGKEGGILNIGVNAELNFNMLCFAMTGSDPDYVYSLPIYEALFKPNAKGTVDPWLLESSEADPQALTYVFHVRRGVVFSDGSVLNASVVKWNLDHYLEVGSKKTALLGSIRSVEALDEYTVKLTLSTWSSIIPAALSRECGYMHSRVHYETHGDAYCQEHPVGTGPFVLKTWTRNISKVFVRNEKYWGGKVNLDGVTYTIYNDPLVGQAAMMSGEIDVFAGMALTGVKPLADRGFIVATEPLKDHASLLVFNSLNTGKDDPTGNLLVRQAICHAIDTKAMVQAAYLGNATVSTQFGVGTHYQNKDIAGYEHNIAKAKELLAKAGYPNGFTTQIQCSSAGASKTIVEIIQADLAKVGVTAKIQILTGAAGNLAQTGWGSGMWYQTSSVFVNVPMQMASIFSQGLSGGVLGLTTMLRPDDVHAALTRSVSATSDEEAVKATGEANKLLIDKYAIYAPIAEYAYFYILNKRVKDSGLGATFYSVASLGSAYLDK